MAPKLPDRYHAQVRLGRDGDIEEWLAHDTALDRPVLVRVLGAAAAPDRKTSFLAAARDAAGITHSHLTQVYDVGNHDSVPHAILEWTGGVTIADRLRAGDGIPAPEFLDNAAGLAEGLAAMHAAGLHHGAIDPGAIQFSAAHPAKLGGFGRPILARDAGGDTAALAATLRSAVTGTERPGVRPSQVVDGIPEAVDHALDAAESGQLEAAGLATLLHAIPTPTRTKTGDGWSWGWTIPASMMIVAALLIATIGLAIDTDPDSPFLFPATPSPTSAPPATTSTSTTTLSPTPDGPARSAIDATPRVYDPFGEGTERDGDLPNLVDGDSATAWRTERYFSPLAALDKPGVGVLWTVESAPAAITFTATPGTRFQIRWAPRVPDDPNDWEDIASGTALQGALDVLLPDRTGGEWLLWLTELPEQGDDVYFTEISEVVFTA